MSVVRIEDLQINLPYRPSRRGSRIWREWCFIHIAFRHFRIRFALMMSILVVGAILFMVSAPEEEYTFFQAMFHSWALVFAELPDEFPNSLALDIALFVFPILGLSVILEGIIDFSLMMRERRRFERSWCTMLSKSYKNHIVLVGFGRLGFRTFTLLRKMGEAVVVIERDDQNQFLEELRRDGSPLLIGDARREALIVDTNIAEARSIILATDDDMANLEIALDARKINPKIRVVLRMFDQNVADKVGEGFDIHLSMSQSAISAPSFATAAIAPGIINSYAVGKRLMAIQRWLVREAGPLVGLSISEVIEKYRVNVVEHVTGGGDSVLVPTLGTTLKAGDGLMIQAPIETIAGLHEEMFALTSN